MENFFPFKIGLPYDLIPRFREIDNESWYEADLEITSPSTGVIKVYGMFDNVWGGRGQWKRDVPIDGIEEFTREAIQRRAEILAECLVEEEDRRALNARIAAHKSAILSTLPTA